MNKEGTEVEMSAMPTCNFCSKIAGYDGRTKMGSWTYMCEECFEKYGIGLGVGKGQRLILRKAGASR